MPLRLLRNDAFAGSYSSQIFNVVEGNSLEDILHDLECCAHNIWGETTNKIHSTLAKHAWAALVYKVSSQLDGLLTRKTAEECRLAYELVRTYYNFDDFEELKFIYEQLHEHFKYSRNPMPALRFEDSGQPES